MQEGVPRYAHITMPTSAPISKNVAPGATVPPPYAAIEEYTRDAVREVFDKMLGLDMAALPPDGNGSEVGDQIIGSVGFVGTTTGIVHLQCGTTLAQFMTARLLGLEAASVGADMVSDAIGELTNMVAGGVKSRLCDSGWTCVLTIPSITRGSGLRIQTIASVKRKLLPFYADGMRFLVELTVKDTTG